MKIIQITDTHLVPAGHLVHGLDPAARLARIVADVCARHADADLAVLTGDLVNDGDLDAYRLLRETLTPLPMPVRLLLGNHDLRPAFRAVFPDAATDPDGFVQSVLDGPDGAGRLLFLDSVSEGFIGGVYCPARREWLAATLAERPGTPVTIFVHHPPVAHGMRHFEHIGLHDAAPLMALLGAHPGGVRHIFFGHIHVPFSGVTADGIAFSAGRGCNHQFIVDFDDPTPFWTAGPLNYTVILLDRTGVRVHAVDTLEAEPIARAEYCPGP